jgi:DNA polymerase-3 subunit alpha
MYVSLHGHSNYSLLDSPAKAEDIAQRASQLNMPAIALSDHGNLGGIIPFFKAVKKVGVKPILGEEIYLCKGSPKEQSPENRALSHLVILARNLRGWKQLIKITSESNKKENFYYRPRLDLNNLSRFLDGNIVGFSGHVGSDLADVLWTDHKAAYAAKTLSQASAFLDHDWKQKAVSLAKYYSEIFGKENFFIEIQTLNQHVMPAVKIIGECLREVSTSAGIPCVATADSHYVALENKHDQQILLCNCFKTTIKEVTDKINNNEDVSLAGFFGQGIYHIPSLEEMQRFNTETEIQNTNVIADMCESYDITNPPMLPKFPCPNGQSDIEYLKELARQGWKDRDFNKKDPIYTERIKTELGVIQKWDLAGYFLIVRDYVQYMKDRGRLVGSGRGSAGGCLTSYLLKITNGLDPIKYNLLFERFFNEGRCSPGKTTYPDIDVDFPRNYRHEVFEYAQNKYGKDKYAHICTFSSLKGKSALKDVLRITNACDAVTANEITRYVPDEAAISDELQIMRDAGEEPSIIQWALEHNSKQLSSYCFLDDAGNLQGQYAAEFKQAKRLEGCKRQMSRHPSAVLLSSVPIAEVVPMVYDSNREDPMCGFDMHGAEAVGLLKVDILSTTILDKITDCFALINED